MASILLVPLLLVLLELYPGGGLAPILAQDCPSADFVLEEGDKQIIRNIPDVVNFSSTELYVKSQQNFVGLHLNVNGTRGVQYDAWFSAESDCFPNDGHWYKIMLSAEILSGTNTLSFRYMNGKCMRECEINNSTERLQGFTVVAFGPSSWLLEQPHRTCECKGVRLSPGSATRPTCKNAPLPTTVSTPQPVAMAATTMVVPMVVVMALVAVVVVMVWRRRQQQQSPTSGNPATAPQSIEPASVTHTIVNDLYEPFDKYTDTINKLLRDEEEAHVKSDLHQPFFRCQG